MRSYYTEMCSANHVVHEHVKVVKTMRNKDKNKKSVQYYHYFLKQKFEGDAHYTQKQKHNNVRYYHIK